MKKKDNIKKPIDTKTPPPPVAEKVIMQEPVVTPQPQSTRFNEDMLKNIFYFSLSVMMAIVWICGFNVGFNSDEIEMNGYGKANYAYYASHGKDTSVMNKQYSMLKYYGNAYEAIAIGVNKMTGMEKGVNEFNSRHAINQVFGILAILFAGLTARKMAKNWLVAIFTIWFVFLTPSFMGHILFNTRDIPFSAGYIAAIYFMLMLLEELPRPTWKSAIGLMISFAFTTNVRIGGLLLLFYLFIFTLLYLLTNHERLTASLKNALDIVIKYVTIIAGGIVLIILTWPFILMHPMALFSALGVASKFPMKVNINFEGVPIDSLHVPPHYLPKYMAITIPILVIVCILGGAILYFFKYKKYSWKMGILLLFTILFPLIYAIVTHAAIYTSWRHFLFVFPGMCIFAGIFLYEMFNYSPKPAFKIAVAVICLAAMAKPILFCIRNNPYEYCYFNEFAGDFKTAFYSYDNDYWEISVKNSLDWLVKNEHLDQAKDTVEIASNASIFATYYLARNYPKAKLKVTSSGVTGRNSLFWTYAVFNSLFLKPDYLENYFPPASTIHSENIDGLPVTAIIKDTVRLDWKALEALKMAKHKLSDSLYDAYIKTTKDNNAALYGYISVAKASLNQNDEAIADAQKCMQYHFSTVLDYNCYCGLGIAYANKRQWDLSISNLQTGIRILPNEHYAKDILAQVLNIRKQETGK